MSWWKSVTIDTHFDETQGLLETSSFIEKDQPPHFSHIISALSVNLVPHLSSLTSQSFPRYNLAVSSLVVESNKLATA